MLNRLDEKDEKIRTLTEQVTTLEQHVTGLMDDVTKLHDCQDELQQYGRRNSLRVWMKEPEKHGGDTDTIILNWELGLGR